jgi:chromosomal replication initiation ATPase DnaA
MNEIREQFSINTGLFVEVSNLDSPVKDYINWLESQIFNTRIKQVDKGIRVASMVFDVPDIYNLTREMNHVVCRQLIMWYKYKYNVLSQAKAGLIFRQDHSTALHAIRQIEKLIETKDKVYYPLIMKFLNLMNHEL